MNNLCKIQKKGLSLAIPFFFLFLIGFISAAIDTSEVDDVFKVNEVVDYSKPCFNNGTYCSASAVCNFTVFNPDKEVIIDNQLGANQFSRHNISITFNRIGVWTIDMTCNDSGKTGAETFYAQVTGSGFNDTTGFYILIIALSFGVIFLGLRLGDAPITLLGTFGLYFLGIYILFNGIAGIKDLTTTWATGIIVLGVAMYISVKSAYEIITG